jgi:hypothetical protein
MKRMRTMQRLVRWAVGSLCLLTLMVQAAPAATSATMSFCGYTPFIDQGGGTTSGSIMTSQLYVWNPYPNPLALSILVEAMGSKQAGTPVKVQLAPGETKMLTPKDLQATGVNLGSLLVETNVPGGFCPVNLFLNSQGVLTAVPQVIYSQQ